MNVISWKSDGLARQEQATIEQLYTPEEVASTLRLCLEHTRRLLRSGQINAAKHGNRWRVTGSEVARVQREGWNSLPTGWRSQAEQQQAASAT